MQTSDGVHFNDRDIKVTKNCRKFFAVNFEHI